MLTLFQTTDIYTAHEARRRLAGQIRQLPYKITPVGVPVSVLRFEFLIEPVDILTWLHNQHVPRKIYWSDRDRNRSRPVPTEIGGIGVADIIEGAGAIDYGSIFAYMEDRLSADNPNLRYYGGVDFNSIATEKNWESFGSYRFIIPRFELLKTAGKTVFAFNVALKDIEAQSIESILAELEEIDFSPQTIYRRPPKVVARHDYPDRQGWEAAFAKIKTASGKFRYDKIVLARKSVFDFDVYINPIALLKHLKDKTPQCFHFCFQTDKTTAFLGASPERLYRRNGEEIETEAVAGTTPRGTNREEEIVLGRDLLNCTKNALEHRYVVDAIHEAMRKLCSEVKVESNPRLVKLESGQHLVTCIEGVLHHNVDDQVIITRLHPTPAVAGCPKTEVLHAIREIEPFDRGWYAGPIGYVGYNQSEFAVGIRSALVNHDKLSLYAGAGIVEGSTAEGEWNEIETKIGNFIEVFNKK